MRRFLAELSAIVVSAALCAAVSNLLAGRERKLAPIGQYRNALVVPPAATTDSPPETGRVPYPGTMPTFPPAPAPAPAPLRTATVPLPSPVSPASPAASRTVPAKGVASSFVVGAGTPVTAAASADLLSRFPPHPDRPAAEIPGADAFWAHAHGVPFLDARRTKVYEEGHIAGARNFAVWEADIDQKVFAFQDEVLVRDRPLVLYCSGGECEDSHMLADKLFGAGFTNVLVYKDGWPDWQKRDGPARSGSTP